MPRIHRVQLGKGKHSGEQLRHIIPKNVNAKHYSGETRVHRVIAGSTKNKFNPSRNRLMFAGGIGGKKGTAELIFSADGKTAEILREVPEKYRRRGIGTDMLMAAEAVARNYGAKEIFGKTPNKQAISTYERAGWSFVGINFLGETPFYVYSKKL